MKMGVSALYASPRGGFSASSLNIPALVSPWFQRRKTSHYNAMRVPYPTATIILISTKTSFGRVRTATVSRAGGFSENLEP